MLAHQHPQCEAEGIVMVTGQPCTGKTILVGDVVVYLLGENVAVAYLVSTWLAADDMLRMEGYASGIETRPAASPN